MYGFATAAVAILVTVFLLTSAASFWVAAHYWRRHRRMSAPLQPIGQVVQTGMTRVRGRATGATPLLSPLSRTPCFYYWIDVQKWSQETGIEWDWLTIHNDYGDQPFFLEDGTGRIAVNPHQAEFDLEPVLQAQVSPHGEGKIYVDAARAAHRPTAHEFYAYLERSPPRHGEALSRMVGPPEPAAPDMRDDALVTEAKPNWVNIMPAVNPGSLHLGCRFTEQCVVAGQEYEVLASAVDDPSTGRTLTKSPGNPVFYITSKTSKAGQSTLAVRTAVAIALGIVFGAIGLAVALAALFVGTAH
jgi:hypothetical protein